MELKQLSPNNILPNPENPRIHFPVKELDELIKSIGTHGVLVPISVYLDEELSDENKKVYRIIDGERRWHSSKKLNLKSMPAWVLPKPDDVANLVTMFNIHMVREPWQVMPTARALRTLVQRTNENDIKSLSRLTGLSEKKVADYLRLTELPADLQNKIDCNEIPANFFMEVHNRVVQPIKRYIPEILDKIGHETILRSFANKRTAGTINDIDELKKVHLMAKSVEQLNTTKDKEQLENEISQLILVTDKPINEAYQATIEILIETSALVKQCEQLTTRLNNILSRPIKEEELSLLLRTLTQLRNELDIVIKSKEE